MNKFSIILPVLNGGEYVKECVRSILAQTYTDFNLIVLDNCSTDGTSEWLKSIEDKRIVIHRSKKPLSIENNWARILTVPKNEFITLIGHDDLLMPEYLQTMDELIRNNPKASLYQTHSIYIDAKGGKIRNCIPMTDKMVAGVFTTTALQRKMDLSGTGFMCRSVDYGKVAGIPPFSKLLFADYALWFSICQKSFIAVSLKYEFAYRLHQNTSQVADPVAYSDALKSFCIFLQELKKNPLLTETIIENAPSFIGHFCKSIIHKMLRLKLNNRKGLTVSSMVKTFEQECRTISERKNYTLKKDCYIKLPLFIDSNSITRCMFRKFKILYKKPIL
jgi:glycosyltransferase involved in cell wall biosynthesis